MSEETNNIELKPADAPEPTAGSEEETLSTVELEQIAGGGARDKKGYIGQAGGHAGTW